MRNLFIVVIFFTEILTSDLKFLNLTTISNHSNQIKQDLNKPFYNINESHLNLAFEFEYNDDFYYFFGLNNKNTVSKKSYYFGFDKLIVKNNNIEIGTRFYISNGYDKRDLLDHNIANGYVFHNNLLAVPGGFIRFFPNDKVFVDTFVTLGVQAISLGLRF
jgi:hypothetical protein